MDTDIKDNYENVSQEDMCDYFIESEDYEEIKEEHREALLNYINFIYNNSVSET